jgi:hypothetical protein
MPYLGDSLCCFHLEIPKAENYLNNAKLKVHITNLTTLEGNDFIAVSVGSYHNLNTIVSFFQKLNIFS